MRRSPIGTVPPVAARCRSGFSSVPALALLLPIAVPPVANADPAGAGGPSQAVSALESRLAAAPDRAAAASLSARIEQLRAAALSPTALILSEAATRALDAGHPREALSDLDSAVVLQPESGLLWRERAIARLHAGDLDGAIADLGQAIARDGRDEPAWAALSAVAAARGENRGALAAWQHVLVLDPTVPDGATRLDDLRRKALGDPT